MPTDLTLASDLQLLALINSSNPKIITRERISFSSVTSLIDHPSGDNTSVKVTGIPLQGLEGEEIVTYNRNPLSYFYTKTEFLPISFTVEEDITTEDVIDLFNQNFSCNLSLENDIVSFNIPVLNGFNSGITLVAKTESLAWTGELSLLLLVESITQWITPYTITPTQDTFLYGYLTSSYRLRSFSMAGMVL